MRTQATFRLSSDGGESASSVSERLHLSPSYVHEIGQPVSSRNVGVRTRALWSLSSGETPEDGVELSEQLNRVLELLEPKQLLLWDLVEAGWEADWFCYVGSQASEHAVVLERAIIERLVALPGELLLDVYDDSQD